MTKKKQTQSLRDPERFSKLMQIRVNALAAERIYSYRLKNINKTLYIITLLTILVPVFLFATTGLIKGHIYEDQFNVVSYILSALLLGVSIYSLINQFDHKKEVYILGRRSNIFISNEALELLHKDDEHIEWFYKYVSDQDARDLENIVDIPDKYRQKAYREALKRQYPGRTDVKCSVCNSSPFVYKEGDCQQCGNTKNNNGE